MFLTTTRLGAYEIANNFMWERKGDYAFILVDPTKIHGKLRPDLNYDQGVWVAADVPLDAIAGVGGG